MKEIKIKYFNQSLERIKPYVCGDWIDLRSAEEVELKKGEFYMIPLGIAMQLPDGYEALVAPRSSTYKNFGIIQTNSIGIIDESFNGDEDQWRYPVYATRDTAIHFNDRICQFRIIKHQPSINFVEVNTLNNESRGGFGSTGLK